MINFVFVVTQAHNEWIKIAYSNNTLATALTRITILSINKLDPHSFLRRKPLVESYLFIKIIHAEKWFAI